MVRVIVVAAVVCLAVAGPRPAAAQRELGPMSVSAEYAGSLDRLGSGVRWGWSLRTFAARVDLRPASRVSPVVGSGLVVYDACNSSVETCGQNGWMALVGARASLLPTSPLRRLDPYLLAGGGGEITFAGGGGSAWMAGGGVRLATRGFLDPRAELRWERHQRNDYVMLGLGVNLRRVREPAAMR